MDKHKELDPFCLPHTGFDVRVILMEATSTNMMQCSCTLELDDYSALCSKCHFLLSWSGDHQILFPVDVLFFFQSKKPCSFVIQSMQSTQQRGLK